MYNRIIKALILIFLFLSCGEDVPVDPLANFDIEKDILVWDQNKLPVEMGCDVNLTEQEKYQLDCMVEKWESAAQIQIVSEYVDMEHKVYDKLEDYFKKDPQIGIHLAQNKIENIGSNILAVCQLYVQYVTQLEDKKLFEILHADIV